MITFGPNYFMAEPTKECPSCAMMVSEEVSVCPICSYEFASRSPLYQWIAILLLIVFFLMLFI